MNAPEIPQWGPEYPDPETLRREADLMAEAYVESLLEEIPRHEIRGIYLKGSAQKQWDSPLDYVPEVSDVDMHIDFHRDEAWPEYLGTLRQALRIQKRAERLFESKVSRPLHTPRPQLLVLNKAMSEIDDFIHSPKSTVKVLLGDEYPLPDYGDQESIRRTECQRLIEDGEFLEKLPMHVIDRPGRYGWESLRTLVWRVSPTAPRVLHISGMDTEEAWSLNRTAIVPALVDLGHKELADRYVDHYLSAWRYFLSSYKDTDVGRAAVMAGADCITMGAEVARHWLAGPSSGGTTESQT
jgi:hypothetical protein